jgi:hypothetical protein
MFRAGLDPLRCAVLLRASPGGTWRDSRTAEARAALQLNDRLL